MKGYTDYPIIELGDVGGEVAPVREVEILDYDEDKYATVRVDGVQTSIKRGYLYPKPGRDGETPCFSHDDLMAIGKG